MLSIVELSFILVFINHKNKFFFCLNSFFSECCVLISYKLLNYCIGLICFDDLMSSFCDSFWCEF